jgi:ketosteroid isomerase-like protein
MTPERITDYLAICETKARYCRTLDSKDWDGYADVFTEDIMLDTRPAGGNVMHGREQLLASVRRSVETAKTSHQIHGPEIAFADDGDSAQVVWAMQDRVVWGPERIAAMGNFGHTGYGQYHELYVRCADGHWRIAEQRLTRFHVDVHHDAPVTTASHMGG